MKKSMIMLCWIGIVLANCAFAVEEEDWALLGVEGEKLFNLGSGVLALGLFTTTALAFWRTKNQRLLFVCVAFFLFAIKGFLGSAELFVEELGWIDPVSAVLNFGILLSFFAGIVKK